MEQSSHSLVGAWRCGYLTSMEAVSSRITLSLVEVRIYTLRYGVGGGIMN